MSARIIIDHANSKIHWFKISQFLFAQNQHGRKKHENFHHAKIPRSAVCDSYPIILINHSWMETLGMGAVCQLDRVLKQDFLGFYYSLLTPDYQPTPVSLNHTIIITIAV